MRKNSAIITSPPFEDHEHVKALSEPEFQAHVRNQAQGTTWMVCFHADWCEDATLFRPIFSRLAKDFGGADAKFQFGIVDVVYARDLAKEFQINDTYTTRQLPSVILFHRGREIRRLPAFKSDGSVVQGKIGYEDARKFFELDAASPSFLKRPKGAKARKAHKKES